MDLGAVASLAYHDREPFAFTGNIKEVVIEISPTQPLIKTLKTPKEWTVTVTAHPYY